MPRLTPSKEAQGIVGIGLELTEAVGGPRHHESQISTTSKGLLPGETDGG